jgi:IMP dehydrogenase/GMP reductase
MPTKLARKYLSFNDVFIAPQYSTVPSREGLDTTTQLGPLTLKLPVISANMPSITGIDMCIEMAANGGLGILPRFDTIGNSVEAFAKATKSEDMDCLESPVGVSIGVQSSDKDRFAALFAAGARLFCVDVAHGHHLLVKDMLEWIRNHYSTNSKDFKWDGKYLGIAPIIIAGNIASAEAAIALYHWGADIIKCGIGPGCFVDGTPVRTINGYKPIEEVVVGDMVLTNFCKYKEVLATTIREECDFIFDVNGIECTGNHEFYVLHKKYRDIVTDDNLDEYATWIKAEELTKDYFLLQCS